MRSQLVASYLLVSLSAAMASEEVGFRACFEDPSRLALRSAELQNLVGQDQIDRRAPIDWLQVSARDEARRKRVGEIFGEGCFSTAADYAAAALIYQHGNRPDHFFQAFVWAKRSVELGDAGQKRLMSMALDRYLVSLGQKQLFGSQASKAAGETCWCLEEVEPSFPDTRRIDLFGQSLDDMKKWVDSLNSSESACGPAQQCVKPLRSSPQGTIPGFW